MPLNGYSIGKDAVFTINTPNGILRVTLTGFDAKPVYTDLKSVPLDKPPVHMSIPSGWKGTAKLDRMDSSVDDYVAANEAAYYAGQSILQGTITQTITEVNGTTSRFRYTNVNLRVVDPGAWASEKLVEQSLEFEASRRLKL
jgi:hypothetical protein